MLLPCHPIAHGFGWHMADGKERQEAGKLHPWKHGCQSKPTAHRKRV